MTTSIKALAILIVSFGMALASTAADPVGVGPPEPYALAQTAPIVVGDVHIVEAQFSMTAIATHDATAIQIRKPVMGDSPFAWPDPFAPDPDIPPPPPPTAPPPPDCGYSTSGCH